MSGRQRLAVAGLVALALLGAALLVAFAAASCPSEGPGQPCPDASRNRVVVVALGSASVGLLVTAFAFLADFAVHRRIVYRGAWWRASGRGALACAVVAVLASLRLGGALTVPVAIFVVIMAILVERFVSLRTG